MKVNVYIYNENNVPYGFEDAIAIMEDKFKDCLDEEVDYFLGNNFTSYDLYEALIKGDEVTLELIKTRWEEFYDEEINLMIEENFQIHEIDA